MVFMGTPAVLVQDRSMEWTLRPRPRRQSLRLLINTKVVVRQLLSRTHSNGAHGPELVTVELIFHRLIIHLLCVDELDHVSVGVGTSTARRYHGVAHVLPFDADLPVTLVFELRIFSSCCTASTGLGRSVLPQDCLGAGMIP